MDLRYILQGRIVTLDANDQVIERGFIFIDGATIAAVRSASEPIPNDWKAAPLIKTRGTIFPGLIDLHNHLCYDILPTWLVPRRYQNRDQWGSSSNPDYKPLISGPMGILGRLAGYPEAIVRYTEAKCLLGGVTSTQGIKLYSNQQMSRFFRGVVRNIEHADGPTMPASAARISDVEARDVEKFHANLKRRTSLLLHVSEGTNPAARAHFLSLRLPQGGWAITPALGGIHCTALEEEDFAVLSEQGASMIWSPLSNLLLYGETADIAAARRHKVRIGLGPDWSPTGSKNLLGELKIARLVSRTLEDGPSDRELVAMATRDAAAMLRWERAVGSIEVGKRADLVVVTGMSGEPYAKLIDASEDKLSLVVINGRPRAGLPAWMKRLGLGTEPWRVGGHARLLDLQSPDENELLSGLSLAEACERLEKGLADLPSLAKQLEKKERELPVSPWSLFPGPEEEGEDVRTHFGERERAPRSRFPEIPSSRGMVSLTLDPLTVADDPEYYRRLVSQRNLPDDIRAGVCALAGLPVPGKKAARPARGRRSVKRGARAR